MREDAILDQAIRVDLLSLAAAPDVREANDHCPECLSGGRDAQPDHVQDEIRPFAPERRTRKRRRRDREEGERKDEVPP